MAVRTIKRWTIAALSLLAFAALAPAAEAQDFFANFFRSFGPRPMVQAPIGANFEQSEPRRRSGGEGQAWCVRSCDGRYFPITGNDRASRASACNSLCPKAETQLVYGSAIDNAATENGKPYSKLPNAFRYRNELVEGCTCTGKDTVGLATIDPAKDPTLRKGDIVAGANGLVVATQSADGRSRSVEFSPASERIKQRFRRPPVVAKGEH
jgi:hypothetical protein